jgi:hypothetical protein
LIGTIVLSELREACANKALVLRGKTVLEGALMDDGEPTVENLPRRNRRGRADPYARILS